MLRWIKFRCGSLEDARTAILTTSISGTARAATCFFANNVSTMGEHFVVRGRERLPSALGARSPCEAFGVEDGELQPRQRHSAMLVMECLASRSH